MKKISYFSLVMIIYIVLTLSSCDNPEKITITNAPIELEITPQNDTLCFSSVFNEYEKIMLKNFEVGDIVNVELVDSLIIIQSRARDNDIHIFNRDGDYVKSLIRYGRAENEVLNIQAMCYNDKLNTIDILCNFGMNILQCSLDGSKIVKIELPKKDVFAVNDIEVLDSERYVLYKTFGNLEEQEYKIYVYDYTKNIVEGRYLPFNKDVEEKISIGQKNNLYRIDDRVYFYETFQNGLYEFNGDNLIATIAFSKNRYSYPIENISKYGSESELVKESLSSNYIWAHINLMQMNNLIFSFFTYDKKVYLNLIDTNKVEAKSYFYVNDDLVTGKVFRSNMLNIIKCTDNIMIGNYWDDSLINNNTSYLLLFHKKR